MTSTEETRSSIEPQRREDVKLVYYRWAERLSIPLTLVELGSYALFKIFPNFGTSYPILDPINNFISNEFSPLLIVATFMLGPLSRIAIRTMQDEEFIIAANALPKQAKTLLDLSREIKESSNQIKLHELTSTKKALTLIGEFLKLGSSAARVHKNHIFSSKAAMEAVACNLRNWEKQIGAHFDKGEEGKFLTEVWIRSQSAYFLEEGFDVGKKILATNGRNLCFVLLAALEALIDKGDGKKVRYTAVTPVNPKDWYNWPHGRDITRQYYESEFIGDYYRVLREIVKTYDEGTLQHSRFVLCHASREPSEKLNNQPFGWKLDSSVDMGKSLNGYILPYSIPNIDGFWKGLFVHDCLRVLVDAFRVPREDAEGNNCSFVPLDAWEKSEMFATLEQDQIEPLAVRTLNYHRHQAKELKAKLDSLVTDMDEPAAEAIRFICSSADALLEFTDYDVENKKAFMKWLNDSHDAEAHLAGYGDTVSDILQKMRSHLLKSLDNFYYNPSEKKVWSVFANQLHTSPTDCKIATLEENHITEQFLNKNIESEFHLFGYDRADGTPDWKLCITATLNYPFEVTKLALHDEEQKIKSYEKVLEFLDNHALPIEGFVNNPG